MTQNWQLIHKYDNQDTKMLIMTLGSVIISIYGQMLPLVILALWVEQQNETFDKLWSSFARSSTWPSKERLHTEAVPNHPVWYGYRSESNQ